VGTILVRGRERKLYKGKKVVYSIAAKVSKYMLTKKLLLVNTEVMLAKKPTDFLHTEKKE
jgi:hypothetical protein